MYLITSVVASLATPTPHLIAAMTTPMHQPNFICAAVRFLIVTHVCRVSHFWVRSPECKTKLYGSQCAHINLLVCTKIHSRRRFRNCSSVIWLMEKGVSIRKHGKD